MKKTRVLDLFAYGLIYMSTAMTIGILGWIVYHIVSNGIGHIDYEFLTNMAKGKNPGIFPMIVNTIILIIIALSIATPIGILGAIYLVEYAKPGKLVNLIRFANESLAGIPSIIYGLFGMILFVVYMNMGWSIIAGALTLSIMILPTILRTTEEALKAVPQSFREGSLGLGATKIRTIGKVVVPSAISGILTGVILGVGRVVGETAAVYLTAGMVARIPKDIFSSGRTLAVHMYILAKEGISFELAYATATVLIFIVMFINILANHLGRKFTNYKA